MRSISMINPANTQTMFTIDLKVSVLLDHNVSLCFVSLTVLRTFWVTFQVKNNVKSTSASTALTQVLH